MHQPRASAREQPFRQQNAIVEGLVYDSLSGGLLAGALVQLARAGDPNGTSAPSAGASGAMIRHVRRRYARKDTSPEPSTAVRY